MSPTSAEIKKQDIIDQLTWDNSVNANEVYVNVQESTVQLKGTVPTYASKVAAEKNRAYTIAMYTAGVVDVLDDIKVA